MIAGLPEDDRVKGKRDHDIRGALAALVDEGYVVPRGLVARGRRGPARPAAADPRPARAQAVRFRLAVED